MTAETAGDQDLAGLNFIRDEASESDFFGSHGRIARAMADVIRRDGGQRMLGLLGPWGSGKSTVVRLMEAELKAAGPSTRMFYYDAWLHQNDPPKRSFLERFVGFLADEGLIEAEDWREKLDILNRRIEDNVVTSTPTLTVSGKLVLASLVAVPFGARFIGNDWFKAFRSSPTCAFEHWVFLAGILLTFAPALAMACVYAFWRPVRLPFSWKFWRRANWTSHRRPHDGQSLLALVVNRQVKEHRSRTTRTPEPSTIEFQGVFRELLLESAAADHRLLIVIDNLDRLPADEAVAMWTTIRGFFLGASGTVPVDASALPAVILPLDHAAVERLFGESQSFIDKTFDLTFHVTAPVLSDWHGYLASQLQAVFGPQMMPEWPTQLGRIFARATLGTRVTPRQVNRLVNNVGVLWMQWHDADIPFASIAYFAVHRSYVTDNAGIGQAFTNPLIDISDDDPNWQRSLAAMHFGVAPEHALQVLIEPALSRAMVDGDAQAFLAQSRRQGFAEVLVKMIDDANRPRQTVAHAAMLLGSLQDDGAPWRAGVWTRLRRRYLAEPLVQDISGITVPAFEELLSNCPDAQLPRFLEKMGAALDGVDPAVCKLVGGAEAWAALIDRTFSAADACGIRLPAVRIAGQGAEFLKVAALIGDDFAKRVATGTKAGELLELFRAEIEGGEAPEGWLPKARVLVALGEDVDWTRLVEPMQGVLRNAPKGFGGLVGCLWTICRLGGRHEAAADALNSLVGDTTIDTRFEQAIELGDDGVMSACASALVMARADARAPGTSWNELLEAKPDLLGLIDVLLRELSDASSDLLVEAARSQPEVEPLSRGIIERRLGSGSLGRLDVGSVVGNFAHYRSLLPSDGSAQFIERLVADSALWETLEQRPLGRNEADVYQVLIGKGAEPLTRNRARNSLHARLRQTGEAEWSKGIVDDQPILNLALDLREALGRTPALREPLYRALSALVPDLLASGRQDLAERWFSGSSLLSSDFRKTLFKGVRDSLLGADVSTAFLPLAAAGGRELFEEGEFAKRADDAVRHVVVPALDLEGGTGWILADVERVRNWLSRSSASTRSFFTELLQERLGRNAEEPSDLSKVAAALETPRDREAK